MDEGVKGIPEDMQPSDAGGLVEMNNAPNRRGENAAVAIFGVLVIVVFGVVIWGVSVMAPPVQEWVDSKINPEPTPTLTAGFYCDDCPDAICPDLESLECPALVCPGCDPCPTVPDDQITDNREHIGDYLIRADEILTDMEASIALMEEVSYVMRDFGPRGSDRTSAFNDKQWNRLVEDTDNKVEVVRQTLDQTWPPGPYNSCNPLLDAHARLLLAFINLDEARDNMRKGVYERDPDMLYFHAPYAGYARDEMTLARLQLAEVR